MLRRSDIDHILRAAAVLTGHARFVMVGTGAVIATARHIPVAMMLTKEIDIYADGVPDTEALSDLIDGSIGRDSLFDRTFGYYGDGVSARTAVMPIDWRTRASEYVTPDGLATATCPSADDIAIAKLCAWREKDQAWLREALRSGIVKADRTAALLRTELPAEAPEPDELIRRLEYCHAGSGGD
jgi:hypothetical protein